MSLRIEKRPRLNFPWVRGYRLRRVGHRRVKEARVKVFSKEIKECTLPSRRHLFIINQPGARLTSLKAVLAHLQNITTTPLRDKLKKKLKCQDQISILQLRSRTRRALPIDRASLVSRSPSGARHEGAEGVLRDGEGKQDGREEKGRAVRSYDDEKERLGTTRGG